MGGGAKVLGRLAPTLHNYSPAWLPADLLAGLTLAAIAVPEQMATAKLVGVPAVIGLYAFIAGALVFALLGSNPNISVGADSTIAPVIATAAAGITLTGSAGYAGTVSFIAIFAGATIIAAGLLRLGWVAEFLSTPVITGALAGIAVQIAVRQIPVVLGLPGGGSSVVGRLRIVADQIGKFDGWSFVIAATVLTLVLVSERFNRRLPAALIGVVLSTAAVGGLGLVQHGVSVVGTIHGGLPPFRFPASSWSEVGNLIVAVLTITFLCIAQSAATARSVSTGAPATDAFDPDLVALGAGSIVAGLSGSFALNASPPRTAVVAAAGGKSQLTSIVAAAITLIVVLAATGLLRDIPEPALGAILAFVATRLFRAGEMRRIWQFDRVEFAMCVATLLVVAFVGIEQGIGAAMVISLAARTRKIARPADTVLEREVRTDHWIPADVGRRTEQLPGVLVYMVYAALWYGNADYVRVRIRSLVGGADPPVRLLVINANGMSDLDYTGAVALGSIVDTLREEGIDVAIARSSHIVHRDIKHSGLIAKIGADHFFSSVEEAVEGGTLREGNSPGT